MIIALVAFAVSFALTAALMPLFIQYLKSHRYGQTIYELGPQTHLSKKDTPNLGGLLMGASALLLLVLFALGLGQLRVVLPLVIVSVGSMAIGFADDFLKISRRNHEGLKPKQKIIGQVAVGLLFAIVCQALYGTAVRLPLTKATWDLGILYIPLMTLTVVFITNSANLQDGIDGLMATVSAVGALGMGMVALLLSVAGVSTSVAIFAFAIAGACLGYFLYNRAPARIFMGDTGSMFLGGAFVGMASVLGLQFWLIPLCLTMIASSLSVIIQRVYFKKTGGKRIFKMSPLHHHFELSGYSENRIVILYGITSLAMALLAIALVLPLRP